MEYAWATLSYPWYDEAFVDSGKDVKPKPDIQTKQLDELRYQHAAHSSEAYTIPHLHGFGALVTIATALRRIESIWLSNSDMIHTRRLASLGILFAV